MITPKEIAEKADKQFIKIARATLKGENLFPLIIPANKSLSGTSHTNMRTALLPLHNQSKEVKGKGYTIEWKERSVDGTKQKLPSKIYFESLEDFLCYIRREKDFAMITNAYSTLINAFPEIEYWAIDNVAFLLNHAGKMADLIKVCGYLQTHEPPHNLYLRELPIEVHSKFIEENAPTLRKLLDILLDPEWINKEASDFSERYKIKKPSIFAQVRILDDSLKHAIGFNEISLTLDDFAALKWTPEKVFIIENKACFLSFPKVENAIAIFGEGFKSRVNKDIPWLHYTAIYCWFDLDAAGFEMLNMVRLYYPHMRNFLMDTETFESFRQFAVRSVYRKQVLERLTEEELQLYHFLQTNDLRLEQEKVTNQYVFARL